MAGEDGEAPDWVRAGAIPIEAAGVENLRL